MLQPHMACPDWRRQQAAERIAVALMDDELRKIQSVIRLSHATHRLLKQNLALALGIKSLLLPLTFVCSAR